MSDTAFWILLWPALTLLGKFIDDYHISTNTKTTVQTGLVAAFVWLDDLPKRFASGSRSEYIPPWWANIPGATALLAWVGWWLWTRGSVLATKWTDGIDDTVLRWIVYGIAMVVKLFEALFLALLAAFAFFIACLLFFLITIAAIEFVRRVLMYFLHVASDPKHSPFTYAGSLLGLVLALAKLIVDFYSRPDAGAT